MNTTFGLIISHHSTFQLFFEALLYRTSFSSPPLLSTHRLPKFDSHGIVEGHAISSLHFQQDLLHLRVFFLEVGDCGMIQPVG